MNKYGMKSRWSQGTSKYYLICMSHFLGQIRNLVSKNSSYLDSVILTQGKYFKHFLLTDSETRNVCLSKAYLSISLQTFQLLNLKNMAE